MANPSEASSGSAESFDISRNDERKSTDTRMSKQSANAKASGGSTPATEGGKFSTGHKRIEAAKPAKDQSGETPQDPAAPAAAAYVQDDGSDVRPVKGQGVKR